MENVITLGKLIGLLFCSVPPPPPPHFVFENSNNTRNELARPVLGTIILVTRLPLYVGLAHTAPPNFRLTFLLTRLEEALYEDLPV